jgi:hypothetical protein
VGVILCPMFSSDVFSSHPQRLEHRIDRIGVESGLELGEQFAGDRRNILHAGHRQQQPLGSSVEGDLERSRLILD